MLKFYGQISESNKKFIIKREKLIFFLASLTPVIIGTILTIIAAIKINYIWFLFLIPILFFISIPLYPLGKKTLDLMIPTKIIINKQMIISEGNNYKCVRNSIDIKKIIDYGNYYQIYFKWPKKSYRFLCQKDLIVEGTLEDFENLFKEKIVRKIKK